MLYRQLLKGLQNRGIWAALAVAAGVGCISAALPARAASQYLDTDRYVSSYRTAEQYFRQGSSYFGSQNYHAALPYLTKAARRGHPRAQAMLGGMYANALGVGRDFQQAVYWNRLAAA